MEFRRHSIFILISIISSTTFALSAQATESDPVGSIGIRIAQIPADVAEKPFADVYIISRLQPATTLTQRLEVFNTSKQEFKVNVYPGAATFKDGDFAVAEGRTSNDLTSWTKLSPNQLILKAGESKTFLMTITPPGDALSVNQFGVIWAEVQGAQSASGITSVNRVGIRMYVPVGDSLAIAIAKKSLTSNTNQIIVKQNSVTNYSSLIIYLLSGLNILLLILLFFAFRRRSTESKEKKKKDKRDEIEWRKERERREEMSRRTGR